MHTIQVKGFIVLQNLRFYMSKAAVITVLGKSTLKPAKPPSLSSDTVLINIRKYFVPGCQVLRNGTVPSNMFLILVD